MKPQLVKVAGAVRDLGADERAGLGLKAADESDDPGAFEVILSTATKDRDGEEVKAEEWQTPLPDHITFDVDHGMSVEKTVGSGKPTLEGGQLIVRGTYARTPLAQTTRSLVADGHIKTTSVAFMRKVTKAAGGATTTTRELLNGAFVAIPANPEAVVLSAKSLVDTLERASDVDPAAAADAAARAMKSLVAKALAGSFEERQAAVQQAIDRLYATQYSTYAYLVGTTDTQAVWRASSYSSGVRDVGEWLADYTIDAAYVVTLGTPKQVRVVEVVTELLDPDGDGDTTTDVGAAALAEQAATKAADEAAAKARQADQAERDASAAAKAGLAAHETRLAALLAGVDVS